MIPIVLRETNTSLRTSTIPDSKRQQTTTVDNKRLINGLVLKGVVSLQGEIQDNILWMQKTLKKSRFPQGKAKKISMLENKSSGNSIKIGKRKTPHKKGII